MISPACDDGSVVTADEIDTLLFDVLGTVVDEAGSMRAELATGLDDAGTGRGQADALADAWAGRFAALVSAISAGAPWRSTDDRNGEALAGVLRDGPRLPDVAVRRLALAGHRLRPWPDAAAALRRLAGRFTVVALSNGNLSMLTDLFAAGGLTWHCVLSGEMVHAYKPDPAVYGFAPDRLALDPRRTLMVAAHPWDLRAAAAHRLRTAYIERAGEGARTVRHIRPHGSRPGRPRRVPARLGGTT
ncbi:MAG: haloacid dehalogenase type II [Trebonia sp.]